MLVRPGRVVSCTPWFGGAVRGCVFVRAPRLFPAFPGRGVLCGRACLARVSAVPRPSWLGCRGVCFFLGVSCFGFVVSVAGCPRPGPCGPCPRIPSLSGWVAGSVFFLRGVCLRVLGVPFSGGPLFLAWCCGFGLGGQPVPLWGSCLWCLLGGGLAASCGFGGRFGGCGPFSRPTPSPPVFFWGGVCLFLPLPSLGWRTHWPAFSVVFRVTVGGCVLLGRVPAPWVGWVMYTLGSAPLPAGLGPGSTGWAAAPGGFVWLWVRGLGLSVSFLLRSAGFKLLGGPPPLLPGGQWPRVWPVVPVCGVLVRRHSGCAVACFG